MDMYGVSSTTTNTNPDAFQIDDLLDFSNEELFSSTTTTTTPDSDFFSHQPPPHTTTNHLSSITTATNISPNGYDFSFTSELCVPNEDVAELEWLSQFVDDSFSDYPVNNLTVNNTIFRPEVSVPGKARSKRSRAPGATYLSWASALHSPSTSLSGKSMSNNVLDNQNQSPTSSSSSGGGRKCTHCASEKTPQWRTGPMGPKTLCNACGVRYKSGRLVPEYRPAASPTFTLTQHSNSHRKVMELRRQKERKESNRHDYFQHHDFEVC